MDEGAPIAYEVLERGVPVFAAGGESVGTVHHVVAAPELDIFHGLVFLTHDHAAHFVAADDVQALHEHGVDLRIDAAAAAVLPAPGGGAPTYHEDPATISSWNHWVRRLTLRGDWRRER